ncbi:MAG: ribonuclease Z [Nanoarchaeota archaeon]
MTSKIKLTFLGTSAQIPTAKRNHSGILLNYKSENILIDCGEGTQRQFRKARLNPCKITRILITHWHGDHVFGLPGILSTLSFSNYRKEVYIYGPRGTKEFVKDLLKLFNFQKNFKIIAENVSGKFFENEEFYLEAEKMKHGIPVNSYNFVIKDKLRIDKKKLIKSKIPVGKHLTDLQKGKDVVVDGKKYKSKDLTYLEKGKKISFVLDTLRNDKIVPFVKNADVFVSESSFSSENAKEAKEHLHLTAEQAGQIAKKAKVKKLILTHISQRYEKNLKGLLEDAKKNFKNVQIVKDLDVVEI